MRALSVMILLVVILVPGPFGRGRAAAREPLRIVHPGTGGAVWVAPPESEDVEGAPRIIFLHGMCSSPRVGCEHVRDLVASRGALVCPTGNGDCGGAADWRGQGEDKAIHLDRVLPEAFEDLGARNTSNDVLVGFSRGAFVARDVAMARPGRYRALVLIGASMTPDPARLLEAGVTRVVLASGDFDPARKAMDRAARLLSAAGVEARFVGLGPIGHALPVDMERALGAHLTWALAAPRVADPDRVR